MPQVAFDEFAVASAEVLDVGSISLGQLDVQRLRTFSRRSFKMQADPTSNPWVTGFALPSQVWADACADGASSQGGVSIRMAPCPFLGASSFSRRTRALSTPSARLTGTGARTPASEVAHSLLPFTVRSVGVRPTAGSGRS
jgi:hypothetical protein